MADWMERVRFLFYDAEHDTGWVIKRFRDGDVRIEWRDVDSHHDATLTLPAAEWTELVQDLAQ